MSKNIHLLLWVPLIFTCFFVIYWVRIFTNEYVDFENFLLEKQVNYAADSAVASMLDDSNLQLDYSKDDFNMQLNPSVAEMDFIDTLCIDWGYSVNDTMRDSIEMNNIKSLIVCCYDGVYAYYKERSDDQGGYSFIQTPKLPYTYSEENRQYILTLSTDIGYQGTYTEDKKFVADKLGKYKNKPSKDTQALAINTQVANLLNYTVSKSYGYEDRDKFVTLPALTEHIRGAQPVNRPTVIAFVEGDRKVFSTPIMADSIGGARIIEIDYVTGVTLLDGDITGISGGKYYAHNSWWQEYYPEIRQNKKNSAKTFNDVFDAAKQGYNCIELYEN